MQCRETARFIGTLSEPRQPAAKPEPHAGGWEALRGEHPIVVIEPNAYIVVLARTPPVHEGNVQFSGPNEGLSCHDHGLAFRQRSLDLAVMIAASTQQAFHFCLRTSQRQPGRCRPHPRHSGDRDTRDRVRKQRGPPR